MNILQFKKRNRLLDDLARNYAEDPNFEYMTNGKVNFDTIKYSEEDRQEYFQLMAKANEVA
jgi:hypothetical protein